MLLSTYEIARICQEQNAAYCRAIGRPDLADPWNELDASDRLACEAIVNAVLENKQLKVVTFNNNVEKIMYELTVAMILVLQDVN